MLCEAASGYYADKGPRKAFLPRASVVALASLGYSTDDSKGNFQKMVDASGEDERGAIADLLLKSLFLAYGVRKANVVRVSVPLLHEDMSPAASQPCVPIS